MSEVGGVVKGEGEGGGGQENGVIGVWGVRQV